MIEIKECPICGNQNFKTVFSCTDHTVSKEKFSIVNCSTCNFLITSPRPSDADLGKYYASSDYVSHTAKANNLTNTLFLYARKITLKWKTDLVSRLSKEKGKLLDIGCGTGDFLSACAVDGWNTTGMEPSENARKLAKQKNINARSSLNEIEDKFQVITLWHVLEHISNLEGTLKKINTLLTSNGSLIIAVPNHKSYDSNYYQNTWAGYDVPRHLWHFSQQNMEQLLHKHGFVLKETLPMKLDSFYVSLLSEGYKGRGLTKFIYAFIIGLLSNIKARKQKEFSSLIYIASK